MARRSAAWRPYFSDLDVTGTTLAGLYSAATRNEAEQEVRARHVSTRNVVPATSVFGRVWVVVLGRGHTSNSYTMLPADPASPAPVLELESGSTSYQTRLDISSLSALLDRIDDYPEPTLPARAAAALHAAVLLYYRAPGRRALYPAWIPNARLRDAITSPLAPFLSIDEPGWGNSPATAFMAVLRLLRDRRGPSPAPPLTDSNAVYELLAAVADEGLAAYRTVGHRHDLVRGRGLDEALDAVQNDHNDDRRGWEAILRGDEPRTPGRNRRDVFASISHL